VALGRFSSFPHGRETRATRAFYVALGPILFT
jgi:hypothetical protein